MLLGALLVVIAAIAVVGGRPSGSSHSSTMPVPHLGARRGAHRHAARGTERVFDVPGGHGGALGEADGAVPDGTTVFDNSVPGVAKLEPDLLGAVRQAATAAAASGIEFFVDSGWRSPEYQQQLLNEAVSKYGSVAEAERWVASPKTSAHVKGEAIDIGPSSAAAWLSAHGAQYGLCQIYANEAWHFELRPEAIHDGCPAMYADPTQDPRMQQG